MALFRYVVKFVRFVNFWTILRQRRSWCRSRPDQNGAPPRVSFHRARIILARILWLQGFPDQAMRTAESGVEDARVANHAPSFCYALATGACLIAMLVGDLPAAERFVDMLLEHSTRHSLAYWRAWASHEGAHAVTWGLPQVLGCKRQRGIFTSVL
jgi:hypothetical protein